MDCLRVLVISIFVSLACKFTECMLNCSIEKSSHIGVTFTKSETCSEKMNVFGVSMLQNKVENL